MKKEYIYERSREYFSHLPGSLWVLDPDVRYPSHSYLMMVRDKKRMEILHTGYKRDWSTLDLPMFVGGPNSHW